MKVTLILALLLIISKFQSTDGIHQPINQVNLTIDFNKFIGDNSKQFLLGSYLNNLKDEMIELKSVINLLKEKDTALNSQIQQLKSQISTKYETGRQAAEWQTGHLLAQGFGLREQRYQISFTKKFTKAPQVSVSISRYDINGTTNQRLNVFAKNITTEGFDLVFTTWFDTIVYSAEASWVAIGK